MDIAAIRSRLIATGYPDNSATDATAARLASLTGQPAAMLSAWLNNGTRPQFDPIEGVGSDFLYSRLDMTEPAAIIALAMLQAAPQENSQFFKQIAENPII